MSNSNLKIDTQQSNGEKTNFFSVLDAELQSAATRLSGLFIMKGRGQQNGMLLVVVVANKGGILSFTPELYTVVNGVDVKLWTAAAAISANGTYVYLIYPGAGTNALFTEIKQTPMPREWKVSLTYSGTPATDKADTSAYASYI